MKLCALGAAEDGKQDPLSPRERDRVRGKETLNPPDDKTGEDVSILGQIEALEVHSDPFPLTPALSLGERESRLLRRVKAGAHEIVEHGNSDPLSPRERDRVRGKGALNPPDHKTGEAP
jgi:hypothetical protein